MGTTQGIGSDGVAYFPYTRTMKAMIRNALVAVIGCLLIATALGKALDIPGYVAVLDTYQTFPSFLHWPVALIVILSEVVIGI